MDFRGDVNMLYMAELIDGDTSNSAYPVYYPTEIGNQALRSFTANLKKPGRAA